MSSFLCIPLVKAERAWSYAMELKQLALANTDTQSRKQCHVVKLLKRAVQHALQLDELCKAAVADPRTRLEAQVFFFF